MHTSTILKIIEWLPREINKFKDRVLIFVVSRYWPKKVSPNTITYFRIALTPIIVLMLFDYEQWRTWIIIIFCIGIITDLLDGTVARVFNLQSRTGASLDPLADKLLIIPLLVFLLQNNKSLLFSIIGVECLLFCIAIIALLLKIWTPANLCGKWKMVFQAIGVLIFLTLDYTPWGIRILWISVGLGIGSILGHIQPFLTPRDN